MISQQPEQGVVQSPAITRLFAGILSKSFLAAYLLTGNFTQAERAVMEAICIWDPNENDADRLFENTLRMAARKQIASPPPEILGDCTTAIILPVELCRVLELAPEVRRSFVLRVLSGLPLHTCADILHLGAVLVDAYSRQAMTDLAALSNFSIKE